MAESGDFEMFSAPAAKEHDEKSDEQFREQMKRAQKAMQQLQKEEGKARAHDDKLAKIIVQFLSQQAGGTDLFLLISRCVAQDIPSELIIAVLSLVDRQASEEIESILKEAKQEAALVVPQYKDVHTLNPAQKKAIDDWIKNITIAAAHKPHRTLDTVLVKSVANGELVHEISAPFVQLSAFIMRNYLAMQETNVDVKKLRDFMENVYFRIIQDLEEMMQGQKKIGGTEEEVPQEAA